MSFKDSKAQILANSASDDSDISTIKADLATTAVVDDGYVSVSYTHLDVYKRQIFRCTYI